MFKEGKACLTHSKKCLSNGMAGKRGGCLRFQSGKQSWHVFSDHFVPDAETTNVLLLMPIAFGKRDMCASTIVTRESG